MCSAHCWASEPELFVGRYDYIRMMRHKWGSRRNRLRRAAQTRNEMSSAGFHAFHTARDANLIEARSHRGGGRKVKNIRDDGIGWISDLEKLLGH